MLDDDLDVGMLADTKEASSEASEKVALREAGAESGKARRRKSLMVELEGQPKQSQELTVGKNDSGRYEQSQDILHDLLD